MYLDEVVSLPEPRAQVDLLPIRPGAQEAVSHSVHQMMFVNALKFGIGYGTSRRLTHGTTTMSNAEEDYDRKVIGDKTYYIKPKSMYPDRDDGREKQPGAPGEEEKDRSQNRSKRKFGPIFILFDKL